MLSIYEYPISIYEYPIAIYEYPMKGLLAHLGSSLCDPENPTDFHVDW